MQTVYLKAAGCEIDLHLWHFLRHQAFGEKISLVLQEAECRRSQVNCFDLLSWEDGLEVYLCLQGYVLRDFFEDPAFKDARCDFAAPLSRRTIWTDCSVQWCDASDLASFTMNKLILL